MTPRDFERIASKFEVKGSKKMQSNVDVEQTEEKSSQLARALREVVVQSSKERTRVANFLNARRFSGKDTSIISTN
jgi:hypothetical protein